MRIGINGSSLVAQPDLTTITTTASDAEAAGLGSFWMAQIGLIDALTLLTVAGGATQSIELGTAVIPTWVRHPQQVAAQALTTQAAVGGRLILGVGLAHQPSVENRWNLKWERPIGHMLDYLAILEELLHTGKSSYRGRSWSFEGESPLITDQPPTVMLAALGDQMLRIAGKRTAGTILWCVGPRTLEQQIVPKITAAADEAGRTPPRTVCSLPVWVTDRPEQARSVVADELTLYGQLPSYRAMLDIEGVAGPADIALIGSADEVQAGLARIAAAGATDFTAFIQGFDEDERAAALDALASFAG